MVFDKLFTKYFMEELAKNINKKDAYSLTTYSIVYNLIKQKKIRLIFNTAIFQRDKPLDKPNISKYIKAMIPKEERQERHYHYNSRTGSLLYNPAYERSADDVYGGNDNDDYSEPLISRLISGVANTGWSLLTAWDTSTKITLKGGYNASKKQIKIVCWLYIGIEWEKFILSDPFKKIYNKILAALLHEGIFIYNYATNGKSLDIRVNDWYKHYFVNTMMQTTNRSIISKFVGNYLGEQWAKYMFVNIEKFLTNGNSPLLKEKVVEMKSEKIIARNVLMTDYVKGPFKELLKNELPKKFDLDVDSLNEVKAYMKDIIEFIIFMYNNRYKPFSFSALKAVPAFSSILPKNGKPWNWDGECLGFEVVGDVKNFDDAYDDIYKIKNAYNMEKFFKKDFIFSEMFMPSAIQAKNIYYSVMSNNVDNESLKLIDCATKGLSVL